MNKVTLEAYAQMAEPLDERSLSAWIPIGGEPPPDQERLLWTQMTEKYTSIIFELLHDLS